MRYLKNTCIAVFLICLSQSAFAQSSPGLYYGQVPTADQWNSYFAAEQDYNPNSPGIGPGEITAYNLAAGASATNLGSVGGGCLTGTWSTLSIQSACITTVLGGGTAGIANFQTNSYASGLPLFAAGSAAFTTGTLSGNTKKLITSDGTLISGHCPQIDSYGGLVDSGATCGGGSGGSGTVTSGIAQQLAYYSSTGTSVTGLSTANNGALVTSSTGVPSISSTLPLLVQQNINAGNIGGTSLNPAIISSSLTSLGTLGSLNVSGAATIPTIYSTYFENPSGNIEILPKAVSGANVYIAPITPYNGTISEYIANVTSGASVASGLSLQTGTPNSYANFVLNDNSGSPFEQIYSGPGITGGLSIFSQAGNLALASQAGTLALSAATAVTSQTPAQGDNSTKIATTAFVENSIGALTLATNAALKAQSISGMAAGTIAIRNSFANLGDSDPIHYSLSTSACSLNSGSGDNISQIKPNTGTGCWIWIPPSGGVTPMAAGAAGNGTTNDAVAVQAAHEATSLAGIPLRFGPPYLYKVNSTIVFDNPGDWEGPYRYGAWSNGTVITKCNWGLVAGSTSMGDIVHGTAATGTIRGVCFDATGSNTVQATAGAGIDLSPTSATAYQSGWTVEYNTILNPYDGIDVNGYGYSSACCGAGSAADGVSVARNTIINPVRYGISNGLNTGNATTVGITYADNVINCGVNGTTRAAAGFALFDGGITYDGTNNGPEGCTIGFLIAPSAISNGSGGYVAQNAQLVAHGVFGDQSVTNDLYIHPTAVGGTGGIIDFIQADGVWAGGIYPVRIDCTVSNVSCQEFSFTDPVFHSLNGSNYGMYVQGGSGGPYDLSITGGTICSFETPASGATALSLNASGSPTGRWTVTGVRIGNGCPGSAMANGINITISGSGANGSITIVGNDISGPGNPIIYTPSASDNVILANNMNVDNQIGGVTAASTILLASNYVKEGLLGGSTTISTINGQWANRQVTLIPANNQTFATGGNICNALSISAGTPVIAMWNGGTSCWNLK